MQNKAQNKIKYIHIALIILGSIFIMLSTFNTNLWFDESYSVGLANHTFKDIWTIDKDDVHPVLYYYVLHILNLIFGNNIIIYRLFSVICVIILGILGYTHIRKDFGWKEGMLFTFLAFFLPSSLVYAGEIRMYSMSMLTVALTFIYSYRIYINEKKVNIKDWILFGIFSLASAYTHYYSLMAAGLINLMLMILLIKRSIENKKFSKQLKAFIICAIIQVIIYTPWLITIILKLKSFSPGFWIKFQFPNTLIDILIFSFTGNITCSSIEYINTAIGIIVSCFIVGYLIYICVKNKKVDQKIKIAYYSIGIFLSVMLAATLISIILKQSIVYARYMVCILGTLMLFMSIVMAEKGSKKVNAIICLTCLIMSLYININLINENYDVTNNAPIEYIEEDIEPEDIFIMDEELSGNMLCVRFADNVSYFYNRGHLGVEQAYKAFAKDYRTVIDLDFLDNFQGRIWTINSDNDRIVEEIQEKYDVKVIKQEKFVLKYKNQKYSISLIEK